MCRSSYFDNGNTELSWKLFNELSDLINSGFPTILNKGDNHVSNK
jgi:hypothetical protein